MNEIIRCKRIYTNRGCMDGALVIKDGSIQRIVPYPLCEQLQGKLIDVQNARVLPGIVEHHIHGFQGWSSFSTEEAELLALADSLPSVGVTSFVVTNHYRSSVMENCQAIARAMNHQKTGARILGTHMEGPFINPDTLGSISVDDTHPADIALLEQLYEALQGHMLTMTLAPELPGNLEVIDWLVQHGINACIGVTAATYEQCEEAVRHGAGLTQKTGNCMGTLHHRAVGTIGAALLDDRLDCEINSDLAHCSKEFLELLYRMKGPQHLIIVSDNNRMSGMPKGIYEIPEEQGAYIVDEHLLRLADGRIDGSSEPILYGIRNWVEVLHVPLESVVTMASLQPAKLAKIEHRKGSIQEGKDADLVICDDTYQVLMTMVEGRIAYDRKRSSSLENPIYLKYLKQPL